MKRAGLRETTPTSTTVVKECEESSSVDSLNSSGFTSIQRDPFDRGATMPVRQIVKELNLVATNSFPSEYEEDCVANVYVRDIHCPEGNSEISWENEQDFVKWKEVQVQDPSLSACTIGWTRTNDPNGTRFLVRMKRRKLIGPSGPDSFCIKGFYAENTMMIKQIHISYKY